MFVQGIVEQIQSCTVRFAVLFQPFPANGLKRSALKSYVNASTILPLLLAAVCNSQLVLCRAPALTVDVRNRTFLTINRTVQTVVAYFKVLPATFMNKLTEMTVCR